MRPVEPGVCPECRAKTFLQLYGGKQCQACGYQLAERVEHEPRRPTESPAPTWPCKYCDAFPGDGEMKRESGHFFVNDEPCPGEGKPTMVTEPGEK